MLNGLKERRRRILGILYKAEPEEISERPNIEKDTKIYEKLDILTYDINEFIVAISRLERFSNILTEQYEYSMNVAEDSEDYNG